MEKISFYIVLALFFTTLFFLFRSAFLKGRLFFHLMNNKYDKYIELTTFNDKIGSGFFIISKAFDYIYSSSEEDDDIESEYKEKIKSSLLIAASFFALLVVFVLVFATVASVGT